MLANAGTHNVIETMDTGIRQHDGMELHNSIVLVFGQCIEHGLQFVAQWRGKVIWW